MGSSQSVADKGRIQVVSSLLSRLFITKNIYLNVYVQNSEGAWIRLPTLVLLPRAPSPGVCAPGPPPERERERLSLSIKLMQMSAGPNLSLSSVFSNSCAEFQSGPRMSHTKLTIRYVQIAASTLIS